MSIYLNSNLSAMNALKNFNAATVGLNKSVERLSSGYKVNRASDGAANLTISEGLRSQIRGMQVAQTNIDQGLGFLNSADSAAQLIYDKLQRLNEIAVAGANGTTTTSQYSALSDEIAALISDIDSLSTTQFNGRELLSGSLNGAALNIQVGANAGETIDISDAFASASASALGVTTTSIADTNDAATLQGQVEAAMGALNGILADIGSFQNQLQNRQNYLSSAIENMSASEASIRNTNVAEETANLTRMQILQSAAVSALAQANSNPQIVMRLLQ